MLLDQAQAEVHVAQKFPLVGGEKERPLVELDGPPDVVQERAGEEQV
jgi:hypothetical protein